MLPVISIIIPTYNYAHYIPDAINSILQQDYPKDKMEIIIVDDGSRDNTKGVLSEFIKNNRIKYYYQENQGKASATAKAIQIATGKYIFNLDADDYFLPGKIKRTVEVFESDENIVHVASPAMIFDELNNTTKRPESLPEEILETKKNGLQLLKYFYDNNILYGGGSTFAASSAIIKSINIPAEVDMYIDEFLILAVLPFGKSFFISHPLSVWRVHEFNYSGNGQNSHLQVKKISRLLKSSEAVLTYLKQNNFDKSLLKIYTLKNSNRQIAYKEIEKTKSIRDILSYAKEVFFNIRPRWKLIRRYQVLNRLIPLYIYLLFKKLAK